MNPAQTSHQPQQIPIRSMKLVSLFLLPILSLAIGCAKQTPDDSDEKAGAPPEAAAHASGQSGAAVPNSPTAAEILEKMAATYAAMTNYTAKGQTVSEMELGDVDFSQLPGAPSNLANEAELKKAMRGKQITHHEFTLKLARPGSYVIEWLHEMAPGMPPTKGAVWSDGEEHYLMLGETRYSKMQNRDMALAGATGVSGGAAHLVPALFFDLEMSPLKHFQDAIRMPDEIIAQENCYVVEGAMSGIKLRFWITKNDHYIKQQQQTVGGQAEIPELSDDDLRESLKMMNQEATPERIAQMRRMMEGMQTVMSQAKGTITQTQRDIRVNQPLTAADFDFKPPAEAQLTDFALPQF
jgi:hypothetical protein